MKIKIVKKDQKKNKKDLKNFLKFKSKIEKVYYKENLLLQLKL